MSTEQQAFHSFIRRKATCRMMETASIDDLQKVFNAGVKFGIKQVGKGRMAMVERLKKEYQGKVREIINE